MTPFRTVTGPVAPLMAENVDTDVIIRVERLALLPRGELGIWAFEAWRYMDDGAENPDFVLNRAPWRGAPILLAGANFGCGSSREAAVWALAGLGIRAVIAPSFSPIFTGNCYQNGLLPVTLPAETVERLAALARAEPGAPFTVDLGRKVVIPPGEGPIPFTIDELRRRALLEGLDDIGLSMRRMGEIAAFQVADRDRRPWVWAIAGNEGTGQPGR